MNKTKGTKTFMRMLACVMAVVMMLTIAPLSGFVGLELGISASAASIVDSGNCGKNVTWSLDSNGTLTISGKGKMTDYIKNYEILDKPYEKYVLKIKNINIKSGVTSIGGGAFTWYSEIESVTIPNTVTSIGDNAFNFCSSLKSITIPDSVTTLGASVFYGCEGLESATLGNGITTIDETFAWCTALKSITISDSVTRIGGYTFDWSEGLKDVYYTGSKKQWNSIDIEWGNEPLLKANIHYNYVPPKAISKATSTVSASISYTGKALKPIVTVKDGNKTLKNGTHYTVKYTNNKNIGKATVTITGVEKNGYSGTKTLTFKIVPGQVKGLKASSVSTTAIKLSWTKVTGAKYYKIEQSTDGKKWKTVATTDKTTYTVSKLKTGAKYSFRVTALDSTKKVAGKVSTTLKTGTKTAAPTVTLKSAKSKTATASWKKITGASKYIVYKSTDNKKWTKVTETTKLTYNLTKLTGGKKIYVKVVAVNAYKQNSAYSKVASVTVKK